MTGTYVVRSSRTSEATDKKAQDKTGLNRSNSPSKRQNDGWACILDKWSRKGNHFHQSTPHLTGVFLAMKTWIPWFSNGSTPSHIFHIQNTENQIDHQLRQIWHSAATHHHAGKRTQQHKHANQERYFRPPPPTKPPWSSPHWTCQKFPRDTSFHIPSLHHPAQNNKQENSTQILILKPQFPAKQERSEEDFPSAGLISAQRTGELISH